MNILKTARVSSESLEFLRLSVKKPFASSNGHFYVSDKKEKRALKFSHLV